MAERAEI